MSVAFAAHRQRGKGDITPAGIQKVILPSFLSEVGQRWRLAVSRLHCAEPSDRPERRGAVGVGDTATKCGQCLHVKDSSGNRQSEASQTILGAITEFWEDVDSAAKMACICLSGVHAFVT